MIAKRPVELVLGLKLLLNQSMTFFCLFSVVISRHVNASDVYAVPFTVAFWQERELTTQSKNKLLFILSENTECSSLLNLELAKH